MLKDNWVSLIIFISFLWFVGSNYIERSERKDADAIFDELIKGKDVDLKTLKISQLEQILGTDRQKRLRVDRNLRDLSSENMRFREFRKSLEKKHIAYKDLENCTAEIADSSSIYCGCESGDSLLGACFAQAFLKQCSVYFDELHEDALGQVSCPNSRVYELLSEFCGEVEYGHLSCFTPQTEIEYLANQGKTLSDDQIKKLEKLIQLKTKSQ